MISLFKPYVSPEAILAVSDVLRSGWIGLGAEVSSFEEAFSKYTGAKYAVATNSATSALHLALAVAGIQDGDEVLTTSLTFVSTNEAILYQRAIPVFVDVDSSTLNMDLVKAEALVGPKTKAILVMHYGGNPVDLNLVRDFAIKHKLKVIEDAAHACGASFAGAKIGASNTTCFSFHAVKNLTTGDGGMITTNSEDECKKLIKMRWMGIDKSTFQRSLNGYSWEYEVNEIGFKAHMNNINAAIGLAHLPKLDECNERRRQIATVYREHINAEFTKHTVGGTSSNHLCVLRTPNRDRVISELKEAGIETGVHYKPNHHYPIFSQAKFNSLENTEKAYSEILSLPLHLMLTDQDVRTVCTQVNKILAENKK